MASRPEPGDGKQQLIDLTRAAAGVHETYSNFPLTEIDDHVVRMSVMTEAFYWHRHPDADETFLVLEGELELWTENERVILSPGQVYTVPAGIAHITSPRSDRSVNITIEKIGMITERVQEPPPSRSGHDGSG